MSIYVELANHINEVYTLKLRPHDEKRGFVKIFKKLLSEKESKIAVQLTSKLENVKEISIRIGIEEEKLNSILHQIAMKGIIYETELENRKYYKLMPFVPGIFEALLKLSDDSEIAAALELYSQEMKELKKKENELVIPMNCKIDIQTHQITLSEIELYLKKTDQYAVMDCICRTVRSVNGKACGHSIKDMCILIGDCVEYYVEIGNARRATKEEVINILMKAEAEGLFHEMYPLEQSKSIFICNCCTCGCMFLELSDRIKRILKYDNKIEIDFARCRHCGTCIESCPKLVFSWSDNGTFITVDEEKCMCCGLCEIMCAQKAIILK